MKVPKTCLVLPFLPQTLALIVHRAGGTEPVQPQAITVETNNIYTSNIKGHQFVDSGSSDGVLLAMGRHIPSGKGEKKDILAELARESKKDDKRFEEMHRRLLEEAEMHAEYDRKKAAGLPLNNEEKELERTRKAAYERRNRWLKEEKERQAALDNDNVGSIIEEAKSNQKGTASVSKKEQTSRRVTTGSRATRGSDSEAVDVNRRPNKADSTWDIPPQYLGDDTDSEDHRPSWIKPKETREDSNDHPSYIIPKETREGSSLKAITSTPQSIKQQGQGLTEEIYEPKKEKKKNRGTGQEMPTADENKDSIKQSKTPNRKVKIDAEHENQDQLIQEKKTKQMETKRLWRDSNQGRDRPDPEGMPFPDIRDSQRELEEIEFDAIQIKSPQEWTEIMSDWKAQANDVYTNYVIEFDEPKRSNYRERLVRYYRRVEFELNKRRRRDWSQPETDDEINEFEEKLNRVLRLWEKFINEIADALDRAKNDGKLTSSDGSMIGHESGNDIRLAKVEKGDTNNGVATLADMC